MRDETFDYVVVGGGSAGCVVASRLSEDPGIRVGLIEAGRSDASQLFQFPALFALQLKSAFDWDFLTEPEPALGSRRAYLPRGRVLGGTSSMNTMVYTRGNSRDYDGWAAMGCTGWAYEDVLPYFRKSEDNERGEDRYHGVGGPLAVSNARDVHPLLHAWVAAASELGYPVNDDVNGAQQSGVGVYQMTQRNGLRCSAATAFLKPAIDRQNLVILLDAHALRVLFEDGRATGVQIDQAGAVRTVQAEREVILCCGAYQSPQLLMLSGVGPADHLRSVDIDPVIDLPDVGEHLQDHPGCYLSYISSTPVPEPHDTPTNIARLREHAEGPLTWTEAGGFIDTGRESGRPDLQFHVALGMFLDEGLGEPFDNALTFGPYVTRPRSRGRVSLRSSVPYAKPRILHNYLGDPEDWQTLREGIRIAMQISRQPALQPHLRDLDRTVAAGLAPASDGDGAIDDFLRSHAMSYYHPAGSCAMGRVVDSELCVFGIEALRVADTSIMPRLVAGNTNAPAIMIGERAADLIRGRAAPQAAAVGQPD